MKSCSKCKETKDLIEFHKRGNGLSGRCRSCESKYRNEYCSKPERKEYREKYSKEYAAKYPEKIKERYKRNVKKIRNTRLKINYDITLDQYNQMFIEQNGCCAICNKHQSEFIKALAVDHDHQTKEIRGLLCVRCNLGIGHLYDNPEITNKATIYLNKSKLKLIKTS